MQGITIRYLQEYIRSKDHSPELVKDYFLKLTEETGELAKVIRKGAPEASRENIKGTVEEEIWDVIYYALAIANCYDIDVERWIPVKEELNNAKYNTRAVFAPYSINDGFLTLAAERYSVREFTSEPVSPEAVSRILEAGHLAPTACNNQPQKIYVLKSPQAVEKMKKCTVCHFNAPMGMLVCYDRTRSWKRSYDGKDSGFVDASIVTTHMMLEAAEVGVGTTWVMHFIPEAVKEEFSLPEDHVPVALLVMGYPAEGNLPAPAHTQFRPLEETVITL